MRHTFTLDSIHKTYISQISLFTLRKNAQPQVKKALSGVSIREYEKISVNKILL